MFLIGSNAADFHGLNFKRHINSNEYDIIGSPDEFKYLTTVTLPKAEVKESTIFPNKYHIKYANKIIEFDATENDSNQILYSYFYLDRNSIKHNLLFAGEKYFYVNILPKEWLFLTKRAHANFDVHFNKTFFDLLAMYKQWEYSIPKTDWNTAQREYYNFRKEEAKARFGQKQFKIKLNKSNEEFFEGGANLRKYVHDDLHRAVAYTEDQPIFEKCKKDLSLAKIEKSMFDHLPFEDKIRMVMEEAMVIALERFYIPNMDDIVITPEIVKNFYRNGLLKVVKDLSKGWFQDFILDNIPELTEPDWNYINRFKSALSRGKVRLC